MISLAHELFMSEYYTLTLTNILILIVLLLLYFTTIQKLFLLLGLTSFFFICFCAASELADTDPLDNVEVDESLFQDIEDLQI